MQGGTDSDMRAGALCLTLDVEPDYGRGQTYTILDMAGPFFEWLRAEQVPLTAYVVGELFAQGHHVIDDLLNAGASVGLHGFHHDARTWGDLHTDHADEIQQSTDAYVARVGRKPAGYRAPAGILSRNDILLLDRLGFRYDTSVFPLHRPGRYNLSHLPRTPFLWRETKLLEMPIGLLTSRLPAGMTFINLLGVTLSTHLMRREVRALSRGGRAGPYVVDLHLHNLFAHPPVLKALPPGMRLVYTIGGRCNGFAALKAIVGKLRRAGLVFRSIEDESLRADAGRTETIDLASLDRHSDAREE